MYLIEILHQTTTRRWTCIHGIPLYLIEILHQTTTKPLTSDVPGGCILSKFYIKPQQEVVHRFQYVVVSYRNSTTNHNMSGAAQGATGVVSYRNSTSNHNPPLHLSSDTDVVSYRNSTSNHNNTGVLSAHVGVVSYRNSTSNHNSSEPAVPAWMLYLIEILHQTTTRHLGCRGRRGLYLIEILHQTTTRPSTFRLTQTLYLIEILHQTTTSSLREAALQGCILSKFYIKPQLCRPL